MINSVHMHPQHNKMILVGGWSMVLFSILYVGITIFIDYLVQSQTMLYGLEQHSLFKVAAGSGSIRFFLTLYALTPLLLIPGAVGTYYLFQEPHEANMRVSMYFATVGAIALCLSLLMLPSLNWHLVTHVRELSGNTQSTMIILLQALHSYFGVFIGDLLGLGCILVWFTITSFVMLRSPHVPHVLGLIQLGIAIFAILLLAFRYSGIIPEVYLNVQAPGVIALWIFICGISMISLRTD